MESTTTWSIRVALELSASGLYSIEEGWIDVLATAGIDIDNEADLARIEEWQAGSPDAVLDSINLDLHLALDNNPNWALQSAMALQEPVIHAQWVMLADSLMEIIYDATYPDGGQTLEEARQGVAIAASLAGVQLEEVPTDDEEDAVSFWARIELAAREGVFATIDQFLRGPVAEANGWLLHLTRETYWESVEDLQSLQALQHA